MRLIDANAYLEKVCTYNETGCGSCRLQGKCPVNEPTVDAEPVRRGTWIEYPECLQYDGAYCNEDIVCSECGEVFNVIDNDTDRFAYCPHCGAKMGGKGE